jgi:hypothetical protein
VLYSAPEEVYVRAPPHMWHARAVLAAEQRRQRRQSPSLRSTIYTFRHAYFHDFLTRLARVADDRAFATVSAHDRTFVTRVNPDLHSFYLDGVHECRVVTTISSLTVTTREHLPEIGYLLSCAVSRAISTGGNSAPPRKGYSRSAAWRHIRRMVPYIYPLNMTRLANVNRIMLPRSLDAYDPHNPRQMLFPPHGPLQMVFECTNDAYPYPGLVKNTTCWNAYLFPYLPVAFKDPQLPHPHERLLLPVPRVYPYVVSTTAAEALGVDMRDVVEGAPLCLQNTYGEPLDVRAVLQEDPWPDLTRFVRAYEHAANAHIRVVDHRGAVIRERAFLGVYVDPPSYPQTILLERLGHHLFRARFGVGGGSGDGEEEENEKREPAYVDPDTGAVTARVEEYIVRATPDQLRGAQVQFVDGFGLVRALRTRAGIVVDGLWQRALPGVPVEPWVDPAWHHTVAETEQLTPAMRFNRPQSWQRKFLATREYVTDSMVCARVPPSWLRQLGVRPRPPPLLQEGGP